MRIKAEVVRHADDIGIAILQPRDDVAEVKQRPEHAVIGQQESRVCMVLRILLQPCFPAIKIVTLILPADYPDAVSRQFLQIRIRNRIARADEYNIESRQRKLLKI